MSVAPTLSTGADGPSLLTSLVTTLPFSSYLHSLLSKPASLSLSTLRRRWYLVPLLLLAITALHRRLLIRPASPTNARPPSPPDLSRSFTTPALMFKRRRAHSALLSSAPTTPTSPALRSLSPPPSKAARLRFLSQTKYLSSLGESHLPELFSLMRRRRLLPDELLFSEAQPTELGMWVVSHGRVGVFQPDAECALPQRGSSASLLLSSGSPMCVIAEGESIGEWALIGHFTSPTLTHPVRAAALTHCEVYFLPRVAFEAFTRRHPRSLLEFTRTAVARQWRIASYVLESVLELPPRSREEVQGDQSAARVDWDETPGGAVDEHSRPDALSHTRTPALDTAQPGLTAPAPPPSPPSPLPSFPRGRGVRLLSLAPYDVLFSAGDEASSLYVVASGCLEALAPPPTPPFVVGLIPAGCVCGGISFMGSTPRGETIRASAQATTVYEYTRDCIDALAVDDPASLVPIARAVGRQLAPICQQFYELGLDSRWFRAGSLIYEQGEASDAVYLVISGRVHAVTSRRRPGRGGDTDGPTSRDVVFGEIVAEGGGAGQAASEATDDGREYETLFEAGRGETLGEETSFGDADDEVRRPYTAVCVRDTECVRISSSTFIHLFNLNPRSMLRFARALSHRVHMLAARSFSGAGLAPRTQASIATIAVVWIGPAPWGGPRSFILSFGDRLMQELTQHGPCVWVDEERLRREVGDSTADALGDVVHRSRASRWLSELEESNRFIVMETTQAQGGAGQLTQLLATKRGSGSGLTIGVPAPAEREGSGEHVSAWTRLCVEQADSVLLVCSADSDDATITPYEEALLWSSAPSAAVDADDDADRVDVHLNRSKDLILLHRQSSPTTLPVHTKAWLAGRHVRSHHHIRREVQEDYARLARFLAGETIGVVLGGGGARGLAHLGVLQALEEEQVPIDCIAGCSQGAFMAALYAKHLGTAEMVPVVRRFAGHFSTWGFIRDLTLPLLSYFNGGHFSEVVREAIGADIQIEDLWLPYFCVTTNVRRSDISVHRFGLLWRYVRASMTLLGFLPPVIDDQGDILLDGGYAANLPVDVMASPLMNAHTVVGVDVESKDLSGFEGMAHLARRSDYGMSISGFWLLWNKLFGRVKVPDFRQMLIYLACLSHSRQLRAAAERKIIDLYIRPPIEGIGLLQYHVFDAAVKSGYDAGIKAIRAWKAEMRKAAQAATEAGEAEDEVREEVEEAAEDEAAKAISDRLQRINGHSPIHSPPHPHHHKHHPLHASPPSHSPVGPGEEMKQADSDSASSEEEEEPPPPTLQAHTRGTSMLRAVSEPAMAQQLLGQRGLSYQTSDASMGSSSNSLHSPHPPAVFARNPSMRMLRRLPSAHGLARGETAKTVYGGVLKARKRQQMKVGWASEENVRTQGAGGEGAGGQAMEDDENLGGVRFERSSSLPGQNRPQPVSVETGGGKRSGWQQSEGS